MVSIAVLESVFHDWYDKYVVIIEVEKRCSVMG